MKGVILNINPAARIVDLNHHVTPFDVLDGRFRLQMPTGIFPRAPFTS